MTYILSRQVALLVLVMGSLGPGLASGAQCDGRYFAAEDNNQERPLARPAPEFSARLNRARAGVAAEQRNLARSYELGYLVSECEEKALYWYGKAAALGDEVAKDWISHHQRLAERRAGPECAADSCATGGSDNQAVVLHADPRRNNHYFAPVTINGHRAEGMIDTGASTIAMSAETAKSFGINVLDGAKGNASTANGTISTTTVIVPQIDVAGIKLYKVPVSIGITGQMLIGMSFLKRLNVAMTGGALTLSK